MAAGDAWVRRFAAYRAVVRGWPERGLLACSGGVDSSALLVLAGVAVLRREIAPFVVVHVDHLTRPEASAEGAAVEELAARYELRTIRATVDSDDAVAATTSPEDQLRSLRYSALARIAAVEGCPGVVTAHTRTDQIETILMRLLSGASGLAAAGMATQTSMSTPAGSITIHRPLLGISRDELLGVLQQAGVTPLIDPTNVDRQFRRNALRQDIIPALQQTFPGFEPALLRSALLASRDAQALDEIAAVLTSANVSCRRNESRVDRTVLRASHPALATRIIRWAAGRLMPDNQRELTFERVESVREAASGRTGATIEMPYGVVARVERAEIVFERRNQCV